MGLPSICPPHTELHLFVSIERKEIRVSLHKAEKPVCTYNKIQSIYGTWQVKKKKKVRLVIDVLHAVRRAFVWYRPGISLKDQRVYRSPFNPLTNRNTHIFLPHGGKKNPQPSDKWQRSCASGFPSYSNTSQQRPVFPTTAPSPCSVMFCEENLNHWLSCGCKSIWKGQR